MRRNKVIQMLNFVSLERLEHHLSFALVAGIDKH